MFFQNFLSIFSKSFEKIPYNLKLFFEISNVFDKWQRCWAKCVALNGEYLESAVVNTE